MLESIDILAGKPPIFIRVFLSLLIFAIGFSDEIYSLAFVHIGDTLPSHIYVSITQARYTNRNCNLYLLVNHKLYEELMRHQIAYLQKHQISLIDVSKLPKSEQHQIYREIVHFDLLFRGGFWNHATERFFFLYDFMKYKGINHLIQIETDVLLYVDIEEILPCIIKEGAYMAAPFEWETRCIPSLVYIKNAEVLLYYIEHVLSEFKNAKTDTDANIVLNDMCTLGSFQNCYGKPYIIALPTIMPEYSDDLILNQKTYKERSNTLKFLSQNSELFKGYIFDAATLGIYVNGYDRRNDPSSRKGTIHSLATFNPSLFDFYWGKDQKGRAAPLFQFRNTTYKVVNLHLHSKLPYGYTSYLNKHIPLEKPD